MNSPATAADSVVVTVELFGMARISAGASSISLVVGSQSPVATLLDDLGHACPELVGNALCVSDDGTISIADGYALNRNGLVFLPPELDTRSDWVAGDSLLLLSNQAGG